MRYGFWSREVLLRNVTLNCYYDRYDRNTFCWSAKILLEGEYHPVNVTFLLLFSSLTLIQFFFFFFTRPLIRHWQNLLRSIPYESLSYNKIVHSFCFLCYSTNNLRLIRIIIFIFSRLVLIHDETRRTFFFFFFLFRINSHHTFPSKSWHVPRSLKNWTWENERMPKKKKKMYRIENYTQACKVAYGKIRSAKRSSKNGRGH